MKLPVETRGSSRSFTAVGHTDHPAEVWRRWTDPSTWGEWDAGLRSASLLGEWVPGATGLVVDTRGRTSRFVVGEVDRTRSCSYSISLPLARLVLTRSLGGTGAISVTHRVEFLGPLSPLWAVVLGRGFRQQIGPTVERLLVLTDPDR